MRYKLKGRPENYGKSILSTIHIKRLSESHINSLYVKVEQIRESRKQPKEPAIQRFLNEVKK